MGVALWLRHHEANDLPIRARETQGFLFDPSLIGPKMWTSGQDLTIKMQDPVDRGQKAKTTEAQIYTNIYSYITFLLLSDA